MPKANQPTLVDTHAHLFWDSYKDDLNEVIKRAVEAGVTRAINVGVDTDISRAAADQAKGFKRPDFKLYSSVAIHPEDAIRYQDEKREARSMKHDVEMLGKIYLENKETVVAVGECGLDYAYFNRPNYLPEGLSIEKAKDLQRQLLKAQVGLAKKYDLPLLLHIRDDRSKNPELIECWEEVFEIAGDHFGILHCYSGLMPTTRRALESNFLFSFAGNLTYPKNDYLKEAVKVIPLDRIVLETDCPFLPPQSIRGKRNEPASVLEIAQTIAGIKNLSLEEVAKQTTTNFNMLFHLQS